ncbi:MAG: hypothetical protein K2X82_30540 [Gemmataceae bacterium]|nr:hypothetical protein [Gemmataceae bacterium]
MSFAVRSCLAVGVIAAGFLAAPGRAAAGYVTLQFDHTTAAGAVAVSYPGGTVSGVPGPYYWDPVGGPPAGGFADPTATFCVQLSQYISTGQAYTFQVDPVAAAAGPAVGKLFETLWAGHYDPAWGANGFTGSTASAAFQLAVWELVYDGAGALDVAGGNFQVKKPNGAAATLAQGWLTALPTDPNLFGTKYAGQELVWLSHPTAQDQLAMRASPREPQAAPVPAPAGLVLGLIGAAGCGLARFRRNTSVSC